MRPSASARISSKAAAFRLPLDAMSPKPSRRLTGRRCTSLATSPGRSSKSASRNPRAMLRLTVLRRLSLRRSRQRRPALPRLGPLPPLPPRPPPCRRLRPLRPLLCSPLQHRPKQNRLRAESFLSRARHPLSLPVRLSRDSAPARPWRLLRRKRRPLPPSLPRVP